MNMHFKNLFSKKKECLSSNEKMSNNVSAIDLSIGQKHKMHVVCTLSTDYVVYYTYVHCESNISEGELKWNRYMFDETVSKMTILEDFEKYIKDKHPFVDFKFTPINFYKN